MKARPDFFFGIGGFFPESFDLVEEFFSLFFTSFFSKEDFLASCLGWLSELSTLFYLQHI